jgi:hypothetical protein
MVLKNKKLARIAQLKIIAGLVITSGMIPESHATVSASYTENTASPIESNLGTVGLDTSSFLYKSNTRGTAATTFEATFHGNFNGPTFKGQGDLQINSFVTDRPQAVVEAHEAYISTQDDKLGNHHFTAGRKYYEWSKLDEQWKMMSLWSPRYTWDQIHPESIGMTGLFYSYETPRLKFLAFASPIAVPERGTPIEEKDNNIVSPNPFWKPLPTQLNVLGSMTNIDYSLMMPSMQEILLRPNFALRARYDFDNGLWFSVNSGVLPIHMVQMAAEPFLDTATTGQLQVNIRPQLPMRNINTAEIGFDSPDQDWNVWLSGSYEQPFRFENQSTWLNPIITPTSVFSAGTKVQLTSNFWFNGSALFIHEQPFTSASSLASVKVNLPTRFPMKQAFKVGGSWRFNDYTQSNISWIQDLVDQNHMVSLDVHHSLRHMPITVGAGTDIIIAKTAQGGVGQYYGDDRLRGWLKYAF